MMWLSLRNSPMVNGPVPIRPPCPAGLAHSSSGMITQGARGDDRFSMKPG